MASKEHKTPLLDDLEKGPWPSFVSEIKACAKRNVMANDLLGQLESAIEQSKERGFLTSDIEVREGAGAYICGEETALIESIEAEVGSP